MLDRIGLAAQAKISSAVPLAWEGPRVTILVSGVRGARPAVPPGNMTEGVRAAPVPGAGGDALGVTGGTPPRDRSHQRVQVH